MSRVTYFQKFSQPENHATNNTLLLFRYFYESSPFKLQRLLTSLLQEQISIGVTFEQQIKGSDSVPDGLISQKAVRLFVETKRGEYLPLGQIRRHCESIKKSGCREGDVLIGLTKTLASEAEQTAMKDAARAVDEKIIFVNITFSQIVEALREQCAASDSELLAIVEDYESYLAEEDLLDDRNRYLLIFPCGTSILENAKFGLYYEPSTRPLKSGYPYIGVYKNKTMSYVGVVQTIVVAPPEDGHTEFKVEKGNLTEDQISRVKSVIAQTPYYDLSGKSHRYYLVDKFVPTSAKKISAGGIMGHRYLDLRDIMKGYDPKREYTSADLASDLASAEWQ